ncbi:MAG: hydrogenase nickel incorporation protein HypB [Syntrophales bacterium]
MAEIRLIDVREEILADNREEAGDIRAELKRHGVFMLNLMSSPGSGKTSLILRTIGALKGAFRIAVIEGDIDAMVDAEKVAREGIPAVQIRTGGACHLDAPMIAAALKELDLATLDCIIIENVGNLVCPAEFDTGAARRAVILSVPEGDDKPLKYPLIFSVSDLLVVNKTDYLEGSDFHPDVLRERVLRLNPGIRIISLSCRTGEGVSEWIGWLRGEIESFLRP